MYIANQILDRKEMNSFSAHVIRRIVSLEITKYYMFYKSSFKIVSKSGDRPTSQHYIWIHIHLHAFYNKKRKNI